MLALMKMKKGDSYAIPVTKKAHYSIINILARRQGIKVITRSFTENGIKMMRVWHDGDCEKLTQKRRSSVAI